MRAVIFANGVLSDAESARGTLRAGDLIIAADGGAAHCLEIDALPAVVIGDFDSLGPDALARLEAKGVEFISHPADKDQTDLELALRYASERGCAEILVYGAIGDRWDHSLANLLLTTADYLAGMRVRLVDGRQVAQLIRPGETVEISGEPGDTVSLVPLRGPALGVTTSGLAYALKDGHLVYGEARGVSNEMVGRSARVRLSEGFLLCLTIHKESGL